MGWKLGAANKRLVCASATHADVPQFETVIVDMNAVCRRDFAWSTNGISPVQAIGRFWKKHVLSHPQCTLFYFAFDSSDRIPEIRQHFLRTVRYARPSAPVQVEPFSALELNNTWLEIWSSSSGKSTMWRLLAECLYDHIRQKGAPDVAYVIDPPTGGVLHCPRDPSGVARYSNYGEADMKAALFANEQARGLTLVKTIDWDMIVQGVAVMSPNVFVDIGTVWEKDAQKYFSKKAAPAGAARVTEYIQPNAVTSNERLSQAFLMLCAAGVDYCDGLKRFGYGERNMVQLLAAQGEPFITVLDDVYTFDVNAFKRRLAAVTPARARCKDREELNAEMQRMWWCILYFVFVGRNRTRGGPRWDEVTFFPDGDTAQAALGGNSVLVDIVHNAARV